MSKRLAPLTVLWVVLAAGLFAGCQSEPDRITPKYVRRNLSPELESIAYTHEQRMNIYARTADTNLSQIWDDIDHILLLDRPVWMSIYPIP